jgi:hypothetical protein
MDSPVSSVLEPQTEAFYRRTLDSLQATAIPFLIGGAYAFGTYTGIERHTKDLDIFIRRDDYQQVMAALAAEGYATELTFPHWLGKAFSGDDFIDVIFNSGNGISPVDDEWFAHAVEGHVLGRSVKLCAPVELIWAKAFIMERERYDGADVAHILRAQNAQLDWPRLLRRFGDRWRVLLSHLVLFGFIYPDEQAEIPAWVMDDLLDRLKTERSQPAPANHVCQGTFLSRAQYLIDIARWGYRDGRRLPDGTMSDQDIAHWTAAIGKNER